VDKTAAETLGAPLSAFADLGCGTGSLSLLLHELGHDVTGLDLSPRMLERARQKSGGAVRFVEGDAARPSLPAGASTWSCAACPWALPDPAAVLALWSAHPDAGGRLCAVEGVWHTGVGLSAEQIRAALPPALDWTGTRPLSLTGLVWLARHQTHRFLLTARLA
jgi:SAM-dependent methyltransferase